MCCRPCQKNGKPYSLVEVLGCDGLFAGIVGRIARKSSLGERNCCGGIIVVNHLNLAAVCHEILAFNILYLGRHSLDGNRRNRLGCNLHIQFGGKFEELDGQSLLAYGSLVVAGDGSLGESNLLGGLVVVGNGEVSSITPPSMQA